MDAGLRHYRNQTAMMLDGQPLLDHMQALIERARTGAASIEITDIEWKRMTTVADPVHRARFMAEADPDQSSRVLRAFLHQSILVHTQRLLERVVQPGGDADPDRVPEQAGPGPF